LILSAHTYYIENISGECVFTLDWGSCMNQEEQKRAKFTVGDEWYYVEDAVPLLIESPLDSMRCENDDIPIGEAVANNGGRFFVCNLDLLDADWL